MKWSEYTWTQVEHCYQAILEMPFITELSAGTLPVETFKFYMAQDSLYLEHFGRALSLVGAKAYDIQDVLAFIRFAEGAIVVENALHETYFKDFGLTDRGTMQPACHHYIHFLKSTAAFDAVEVGMAALLPCFWIYKKVGDHIFQNQETVNNPYKKWIQTYSNEDFGALVQQAINICDAAAERSTPEIRERMTQAFITSSHLEFDFWQGAYHNRKWNVF
ncbi:thiaminase II [Terrimonas rubra]|uniref:Aminopyrimidine aminohydrolase n=1 Tax=Terrimonas rubra TaxID=1035890 RepID=A0ABW6A4D4_9BACT